MTISISTAANYLCQHCGDPIHTGRRCEPAAPTPLHDRVAQLEHLVVRLIKDMARMRQWSETGVLVSTAEYGVSFHRKQESE